MPVLIERNEKNIIITLPSSISPVDLQKGISFFKFLDIVERSQATQEDIDRLATSVKSAIAKPIIERLKELDEFRELPS